VVTDDEEFLEKRKKINFSHINAHDKNNYQNRYNVEDDQFVEKTRIPHQSIPDLLPPPVEENSISIDERILAVTNNNNDEYLSPANQPIESVQSQMKMENNIKDLSLGTSSSTNDGKGKLTLEMLAQISGLVDFDAQNPSQYGTTYDDEDEKTDDEDDEVEKAVKRGADEHNNLEDFVAKFDSVNNNFHDEKTDDEDDEVDKAVKRGADKHDDLEDFAARFDSVNHNFHDGQMTREQTQAEVSDLHTSSQPLSKNISSRVPLHRTTSPFKVDVSHIELQNNISPEQNNNSTENVESFMTTTKESPFESNMSGINNPAETSHENNKNDDDFKPRSLTDVFNEANAVSQVIDNIRSNRHHDKGTGKSTKLKEEDPANSIKSVKDFWKQKQSNLKVKTDPRSTKKVRESNMDWPAAPTSSRQKLQVSTAFDNDFFDFDEKQKESSHVPVEEINQCLSLKSEVSSLCDDTLTADGFHPGKSRSTKSTKKSSSKSVGSSSTMTFFRRTHPSQPVGLTSLHTHDRKVKKSPYSSPNSGTCKKNPIIDKVPSDYHLNKSLRKSRTKTPTEWDSTNNIVFGESTKDWRERNRSSPRSSPISSITGWEETTKDHTRSNKDKLNLDEVRASPVSSLTSWDRQKFKGANVKKNLTDFGKSTGRASPPGFKTGWGESNRNTGIDTKTKNHVNSVTSPGNDWNKFRPISPTTIDSKKTDNNPTKHVDKVKEKSVNSSPHKVWSRATEQSRNKGTSKRPRRQPVKLWQVNNFVKEPNNDIISNGSKSPNARHRSNMSKSPSGDMRFTSDRSKSPNGDPQITGIRSNSPFSEISRKQQVLIERAQEKDNTINDNPVVIEKQAQEDDDDAVSGCSNSIADRIKAFETRKGTQKRKTSAFSRSAPLNSISLAKLRSASSKGLW